MHGKGRSPDSRTPWRTAPICCSRASTQRGHQRRLRNRCIDSREQPASTREVHWNDSSATHTRCGTTASHPRTSWKASGRFTSDFRPIFRWSRFESHRPAGTAAALAVDCRAAAGFALGREVRRSWRAGNARPRARKGRSEAERRLTCGRNEPDRQPHSDLRARQLSLACLPMRARR